MRACQMSEPPPARSLFETLRYFSFQPFAVGVAAQIAAVNYSNDICLQMWYRHDASMRARLRFRNGNALQEF